MGDRMGAKERKRERGRERGGGERERGRERVKPNACDKSTLGMIKIKIKNLWSVKSNVLCFIHSFVIILSHRRASNWRRELANGA